MLEERDFGAYFTCFLLGINQLIVDRLLNNFAKH